WMSLHAVAAREEPTGLPDVQVAITTRDLTLTTLPKTRKNPDGTLSLEGKPMHVEGLAFAVGAKVEGKTGDTYVHAALDDRVAPLLRTEAHARLPLGALLGGAPAQPLLLTTPVKAHVTIPERALDSLPAVLGRVPFKGRVAFDADFDGTARAPR